jgi:AAHS family benzoate transporter-like MFS transporter
MGPARYLGRAKSGSLIAAICCLVVAFDGYDISAYGVTVPAILDYHPWHASADALGLIGSLTLVGMLVGTLVCGFATDRLGRKLMLIMGSAWFSLCMLVCALAPNLVLFGTFRLLAGIGLGGVLPSVITLAVEFAPAHRRNLFNAVANMGFSFGTIGAAVLGIVLIDNYGFRTMYAVAVLPLLLVPVAWFVLPESPEYLASKGRHREAQEVAARYGLTLSHTATARQPGAADTGSRIRMLLTRSIWSRILLFGLAGICVQLDVYGLNTWLPQLMRDAGYPPTSALALLGTLSVGAIVGALVLSTLADRFGPWPLTLIAFGTGALALAILSSEPPEPILYLAVALAGAGSNGTANVLYGFAANWFPVHVRASAVGSFIALARVGGILAPITGGWIISAGLSARWNFLALLVPALMGVIVGFGLPRRAAPLQASTGLAGAEAHPTNTPK